MGAMGLFLDRLGKFGQVEDLELTFRRIAFGARLFGLAWMAVLAIVTLAQGGVPRPWVVLVAVAAAAIWSMVSAATQRSDFSLATSRGSILVDLVLAAAALWAPRWAGVPTALFYGGFPLLTVAVATVRSRKAGWLVAALLSMVTLARGAFDLVVSVSQVITNLATAALLSWVLLVLRRSEATSQEAQAARVRAEERSAVAAHLHDSVLQTLALIQRSAADPGEVGTLARRQERELRSWLYGPDGKQDRSVAAELRATVDVVETDHRVEVELVVVGDGPLTASRQSLIAAGREALVNAAKHSGAGKISAYLEVGDTTRLFVRDRGVGFDPAAVGPDRHGLADSITGRLAKVGGRAEVRSEVGAGTEIRLEVEG